jgi:hypothetical protein
MSMKRTLALLACFLLAVAPEPSRAAGTTAYQLLFGNDPVPSIGRIVVARHDPEVETILTVTPSRIMRGYTSAAIVQGEDRYALALLMDVLRNTDVGEGTCDSRLTSDANALPTGWGISIEDVNGKQIALIALTQDGDCAAIRGRLHPVDTTLIAFLSRYFSFLNFPRV